MSFRYTNVQYCEMVRMLARCGDNVNLAVRQFREEFGISVSNRTMLAATQRLRDYGSFRPSTAVDRGVEPHDYHLEDEILDYFRENPTTSTREAGRRFRCSHTFVRKVLRDDNQHPYHYRRCQELNPLDYQPRVTYCEWYLENANRNIIFTDECTFTRRGLFNQHNRHVWAHENPHLMQEDSYQHRFSVNVWAGIVGPIVLGPVFLPRLTGETYLEFLTTTFPQLLEDVPLQYVRGMYFQHDGAPSHFQWNVRRYLDEEYGERWVGRGGPIQWPPRSPDLTVIDYFLWGRVKGLVYDSGNVPSSVDELQNKIISAFDTIKSDREVLNSLKNNTRKRALLCIEQGGRHFESLLQQHRNSSL